MSYITIGRFCISKFYDKEDVNKIQKWFLEKDRKWRHGSESLIGLSSEQNKEKILSIKNNFSCADLIPAELVMPQIEKNLFFRAFTSMNFFGSPMLTKTPVGGYYNPHFDGLTNGHFSTTIFLDDPSDYDGGELVLFLDGKEEFFKLDPGWGITYETGIGHRVNTVTRGNRHALVFWTFSDWSDLDKFREWKYWLYMTNRLEESLSSNLEDFCNNPHTRFRNKSDNILKKIIPTERLIEMKDFFKEAMHYSKTGLK